MNSKNVVSTEITIKILAHGTCQTPSTGIKLNASTRYEFNSIGAKDGEFNSLQKLKSAILIGDSMAEGFGLSNEHSLDAAIEDLSGIDVLNFGTSGVLGTTQYSLLYEKFNQQFEHQYLLILLTLSNDFLDDSQPILADWYIIIVIDPTEHRVMKTDNDYVLSYLGRS